jgi:hypothetical protein
LLGYIYDQTTSGTKLWHRRIGIPFIVYCAKRRRRVGIYSAGGNGDGWFENREGEQAIRSDP